MSIVVSWRDGRDSNPHLTLLERAALPLCYLPTAPGRGIEPRTMWLTATDPYQQENSRKTNAVRTVSAGRVHDTETIAQGCIPVKRDYSRWRMTEHNDFQ